MSAVMEKQDWVPTRYLADALGVSMTKARSLVEEHKLTVFQVGHRWRIARQEADELIEFLRTVGKA